MIFIAKNLFISIFMARKLRYRHKLSTDQSDNYIISAAARAGVAVPESSIGAGASGGGRWSVSGPTPTRDQSEPVQCASDKYGARYYRTRVYT